MSENLAANTQHLGGTAGKGDRHQRRREIAHVVAQLGRVTVDEIKERFGISGVTARHDLDALADAGDIIRSHGGAISTRIIPEGVASEVTAASSDEQSRMAAAAVKLICPLETVMLCAGEATTEMARLLRQQCPANITIVTYSLQIASVFSEASQTSVVMLGGLHRYPSGCFAGPHAEQMMKSLHAGHCFLNAPGLSLETGITTSDIMEAHLIQRMIDASAKITVLAEMKTFGYQSLALVAELDKIDRVICDASISADDCVGLKSRGVELLLV